MLSPADVGRVRLLKQCGIKMPVRCLLAARKTGLPLSLAASILIQETGGGRNEWGHDPTIFIGGYDAKNKVDYGATVTKKAYKAYLDQRGYGGHGGMQGVGPCQLTYFAFQDQADAKGGCWRPYPNMLVGFGALAASVRKDGLRLAVVAYNGSGSAAEEYANVVLRRMDSFKAHGL